MKTVRHAKAAVKMSRPRIERPARPLIAPLSAEQLEQSGEGRAPLAGIPSLDAAEAAEILAVGHQSSRSSEAQDDARYRAFQSNLLSLISHELRTPLTGVLNALSVLDGETAAEDLSERELITMARKNAQRLHQALVTLLDLAALETGTFHVRLRELDLLRLMRSRLGSVPELKEGKVEIHLPPAGEALVLADPQKIGRALELCFQLISKRAEPGTTVHVRGLQGKVEFDFQLAAGGTQRWRSDWSHALAGVASGVAAPGSAFGGVLQSEQDFLSRSEEGLGSELLLVHQIMRLHAAECQAEERGNRITLRLVFPSMTSEQGLRAVLSSRAYEVSNELGSVALALVRVPVKSELEEFCQRVKSKLFRATDAVYPVPERRQIAVVLDDCRREDVASVMKRLEHEVGRALVFGVAHCPTDGVDPVKLIDLAAQRLLSFGALEGGSGSA